MVQEESNRNTVPKQLKPFVKGDPRINRKGRPRTFDALRQLAQEIAHEVVRQANGEPALVNGKPVTTIELVMRSWAQSKDPRKQVAFIEYAFGKVPQATELTGKDGGDIGVKHTLGADLMTAIERVYGSDSSSNGGDSGDSDGSDETPN